jgi:hypothetical protein
LWLPSCGGPKARPEAAAAPEPQVRLAPVTRQAGLKFRHEDGSSGRKYFPEVMGPGCAFADFDGDGRPDVYLINGDRLPGAPPGPPIRPAFYRNNGDGTFTDATESSGLGAEGYGIGCCLGDYDNDGYPDLYVTRLGRSSLYHNNRNGTFTDVTAQAGAGVVGFCTGAAFGDYDNDGYLDLYVCRYVVWSPEHNLTCRNQEGQKSVVSQCRPNVYPPARGVLFHNNGHGGFTDVTARAGMNVSPDRSLGCLWTDIDADGDPDLFVANDMGPNFLFVNNGKGRFTEEALARGVAVGSNGRPQASMGVAAVDYDGDGRLDLACTSFSGEYLALYHNMGGGTFQDASAQTGLVAATAPYVGFGLGFPDLDLDGRPDLFVANGHVTEAAEHLYPGVTFSQPRLLLLNDGHGGFAPAASPGPAVTTPRVGRGVAFADYDGDGKVDVLIANWRDEPDLLRNEGPGAPGAARHWLRLRLRGARCNRLAIGARVEVAGGGRTQVQEVRSGGSYCSQSELTLSFGLGADTTAAALVRWPGGGETAWTGLRADREHLLQQQ